MNFGEIKSIILFGGGQLFSESALKLIGKKLEVFIVTSERHSKEMVKADGKTIALLEFLQKNKLDFIISKDINTDQKVIKKIGENTLGISISAAWVFKQSFISLFKGRLVNLHGANLPRDRGGGGASWRVMRNVRHDGCVIHILDPGIDTGVILKRIEYTYPDSCRIPREYEGFSIQKVRLLMDEFIDNIVSKKDFAPVQQDENLSTYWPRLYTDAHAYIDWSWRLSDIERFACAFDDHYSGAITFINGMRVRLKKCSSTAKDGVFHPFQAGLVYRIIADSIFIATENGGLIVRSVTEDNGENAANKIKIGDRFYSPIKFLEEAKQFRANYTPEGLKR